MVAENGPTGSSDVHISKQSFRSWHSLSLNSEGLNEEAKQSVLAMLVTPQQKSLLYRSHYSVPTQKTCQQRSTFKSLDHLTFPRKERYMSKERSYPDLQPFNNINK